jgi:hypothetical protein
MKLLVIAMIAGVSVIALAVSANRSVRGGGGDVAGRTIYKSFGSTDGKAMFSLAIHEPALGGPRSLETTIAFVNEYGGVDYEQATRPDTSFGVARIEIKKGPWRAVASNSVDSWSKVTSAEEIAIQLAE